MNLRKGQRFNLSKEAPNLTVVRIGLGWDTAPPGRGTAPGRGGESGDPFASAGDDPADKYSFGSAGGQTATPAPSSADANFDLDVCLFMLGADGRIPDDAFFIFYNNLRSPDGAVIHQGDNRTGAGEGDDETILVNLQEIDPRVRQLLVMATIHEAQARRQSFSQVRNAYVRLVDNSTGKEVLRYALAERFSTETALVFAELDNQGGAWRFRAVGQGSNDGLQEFVDRYA